MMETNVSCTLYILTSFLFNPITNLVINLRHEAMNDDI